MNKFTLQLIKGLTGIDIEELESRIDSLQTKNQQLSFLIKDANREASYKRTQFIDLQKQLSLSEGKKEEQQIILTAQSQEINILQEDLMGLSKWVSKLQTEQQTDLQLHLHDKHRIKELEDKVKQLSNQLQGLQQHELEVQKKSSQLSKQVEQLQAEYLLLKDEKENLTNNYTHTASIQDELKQTLQTTERKNKELNNALTELQKELKQIKDEKEEALHMMQLLSESNREEKENHVKEMQQIKVQLSSATDKQTLLQEEIHKWQSKYDYLQQDLAKTEKEKEEQNCAFTTLQEDLKQTIEKKEKTLNAVQSLLENSREEKDRHTEEIRLLKENLLKQTKENDRIAKEMEQMKIQLSLATDKQTLLQEEANEWQSKHDRLQQDLTQTAKEKEEQNRAFTTLQEELKQTIEKKEKTLNAVQSLLENSREEKDRHTEEIRLLQENLLKQTKENDRIAKEMEQMKIQLSLATDKQTLLQEEANEWQSKYDRLQQDLAQTKKEKEELIHTLSKLKEEQTKAPQKETQHSLQEVQSKENGTSVDIEINKEEVTTAVSTSNSIEISAGQRERQEIFHEKQIASEKGSQSTLSDGNHDLLQAYQTMKTELEKSSLHYPYTRITTHPNGCQYIYDSQSLHLKTELFTWGIEGKEVILDEPYFITHDEIERIEGLETPFLTENLVCDFSNEGNGDKVAETLLMGICCYHPLHITYRDKNGRISERNLYWICFQSTKRDKIDLPYENLFNEMMNGEIDSEHISAMHSHHQEPKIFIINQIQSIQVFDAFVTTEKGIKAQIDGLYTSVLTRQPEAAEMIYQCLPTQFKQLPSVISRRAHYEMLTGNYEKAMELYLSIAPDTFINEQSTWQQANGRDFEEFIQQEIESESFEQLKEALREEGWEI